jgi:glutaminase
MAATLANGGVNPLTKDRVFNADTVRNCLSIMYACGMYDYSGEFSFRIGLP